MRQTLNLLSIVLLSCVTLSFAQADDVKTKHDAAHAKGHHDKHDVPDEAVVILHPTAGNAVTGTLILKQFADGVHVIGKVNGLTPGEHGFHIHQYGDLRAADGTSAGGHYSGDGHQHGGPDDAHRHAGDLGNITAEQNGVAIVDKKAKGLKLHFVIGRSFVVHQGADDFKSQPSGNAGPRVAVGVIGFANVEDKDKK